MEKFVTKHNWDDERWPNFKSHEFTCPCGNEHDCSVKMQEEFMDMLQNLRCNLGFPLKINSGYRCTEHPKEKKEIPGWHAEGRAVDIRVHGEEAFHLVYEAIQLSFQGIGVNQKGDTKERFIHLDNGDRRDHAPRPRIWSY